MQCFQTQVTLKSLLGWWVSCYPLVCKILWMHPNSCVMCWLMFLCPHSSSNSRMAVLGWFSIKMSSFHLCFLNTSCAKSTTLSLDSSTDGEFFCGKKWCLPHIVSLDSILTHKWCSALLTSLYLRGFKRLYRPGPGKFFEIYIIYSLLFFCAMTSVLTSTPNLLREISSSRPRKLLSRTFPEGHAWVNMSHTTIAAERWTVNYFSRRRAKWDWCV